MVLTTDPDDPRLTHGPDPADGPSRPQAEAYLVLPEEERAKGFVRPVRTQYWHAVCGRITIMGTALAETYARDPGFYGATFCAHCGRHRPVGEHGEFYWCDQDNAGTMAPARQPKVGT